jgi:chaperonin GroES
MLEIHGSNILVKPVDEESVLPSGLILPDQRKKEGMVGEVIELGSGVLEETLRINSDEPTKIVRQFTRRPIDGNIKVGAKVIYPKYAGYVIEQDGVKYLLVRESEILGVVEE